VILIHSSGHENPKAGNGASAWLLWLSELTLQLSKGCQRLMHGSKLGIYSCVLLCNLQGWDKESDRSQLESNPLWEIAWNKGGNGHLGYRYTLPNSSSGDFVNPRVSWFKGRRSLHAKSSSVTFKLLPSSRMKFWKKN